MSSGAQASRHWGHSSAGRAPALHAGGQEFDPPWLHHYSESPEMNIPSRIVANVDFWIFQNRSLKIRVCDRSDLLSVSLHSATQGKICEFKREFSANVVLH